jgi:hypothetical protein
MNTLQSNAANADRNRLKYFYARASRPLRKAINMRLIMFSANSMGFIASQMRGFFFIVAVLVLPSALVHAAGRARLIHEQQSSNTFYISPAGNDDDPGTKASPFRTLQKARDTIATRAEPMQQDIYVYLRGGTYPITTPIIFTSSDSGTNGHIIHYLHYKNEKPLISGGQRITGWTRYKGDIYETPLERNTKLRQLYVDGQRAFMARGKDFPYTSEIHGYGTFKITGKEPWAMTAGTRFAGFTFSKDDLGQYTDPGDVELVSKAGFGHHIISLSNIESLGSTSAAILQQPIGSIAQSIPQYGDAFISDKPDLDAVSEFHFQNALALLSTAGQFYFDRLHKTLYYYKRPNEDMSTADVIAPLSEGLMILKGISTKQRVSNIEFRGITFAYSHYSLTKVGDSYGDTGVQSIALYTKYTEDGNSHAVTYKDNTVQRAAIECENSDRIDFTGDIFNHMGAVALSLGNDSNHSKVVGNVFYDIGSSAINIGDPKNVYIGDGDFPPGIEGVPSGDVVQNNYMKELAVESLQAPAASIFYTKNFDFSHNEISDAPYTGISLGWGWTSYTRIAKPDSYSRSSADNKIDYNRISNVMREMHDGAGIYILGEQPDSEIVGNYFGIIGGFSEGTAIYLDQGSRFLTITNNYSENPNGWFFVWGKAAQVYNIKASDNYSSKVIGDEGAHLNDSPSFHNARSTPNHLDRRDKTQAGLERPHRKLRTER